MISLRVIVIVLVAFQGWPGLVVPGFASGVEHHEALRTIIFTQKAAVQANRERLYISDVASCEGSDDYCEEAYGIDIGSGPEPGRATFVDRDSLEKMIASEWPMAIVDFLGSKRTRVEGGSANLEESVVKAWLDQQVRTLFAEDERVRIRLASIAMPKIVRIRPGDYQLTAPELEELRNQSLEWRLRAIAGHKSFKLVVHQPAGVEEFSLRAHFEVESLIGVAARTISANETVKADDVKQAWIIVAPNFDLATVSVDAVGQVAKRKIGIGKPILVASLSDALMVKRGSLIQLVVRKGGVSVESSVKALGQGGIGDVISVELPTRKKIRAEITGQGKARATF